MGLFKSKEEAMLDIYIDRINMNMSNNYKDAAQINLHEFEELLNEVKMNGKMKEKKISEYESKLGIYKQKLKGFTHKDQKPYWT